VRVRGASGLGDAVYLYPIVKHFSKAEDLIIYNNFPQLFKGLGEVKPYTRNVTPHIDCGYPKRSKLPGTIFESMLACAKIKTELKIDYDVSDANVLLPDNYIVVSNLYLPMNSQRSACMKPNEQWFKSIVKELSKQYKIVVVGNNEYQYKGESYIDMTNKTSPIDLLHLVSNAELVFTQCGFLVPMAQALDTNVFTVFSQESKLSKDYLIKGITPSLICEKNNIGIYDNIPQQEVLHAISKTTNRYI
jgi:hypothetical protein